MKKTFLPIILVIALLLSQISVFAFEDMDDESLVWAQAAVEEMNEAGLIKGYEDGTFRPNNAVTKQEALVLIARVLGFTDESSEDFSKVASEVYAEELEDLSTPYKNEISYLLYRNIITVDDIAVFASDAEAAHPLSRYEAAILFTKIFERDLSVVEKAEITLEFDDNTDIPATAKPYVNYVCENGIMNGMGDNLFKPNEKITRAMIATLLYRIIPVLEYDFEEGSMLRYDESTSLLRLSLAGEETATYTVDAKTVAVLDGYNADLSDFPAGTQIRLTFSGKDIVFVEGISSSFETTVDGIYNGFESYENATVVLIKSAKTNEVEKYTISDSVTVVKNGGSSSINKLVKTDYVYLSIKAGKVIHIQAEDKTLTVKGTIDSIDLEPEFALNVKVGGEIIAYSMGSNVTVRRNSKVADLSDVAAGDDVEMTLTYGLVTEIIASSDSVNETGIITEIVISNTPSLKVEIDGDEYTYFISRNASIEALEGDSIYDLRLGDTVKLVIEGKTITDLSIVESVSQSTNLTGVVESVESSYGYIKLADSATLVFTKSAKIQDNSGSSMTIRQLKAGDVITVFGKATSGAIEATLIIVNK